MNVPPIDSKRLARFLPYVLAMIPLLFALIPFTQTHDLFLLQWTSLGGTWVVTLLVVGLGAFISWKLPFAQSRYTNLVEGNRPNILPSRYATLGAMICSETLSPYPAARAARNGAQALIAASNTPGSPEPILLKRTLPSLAGLCLPIVQSTIHQS